MGENPGTTNTYTRSYKYDKQGNILELKHTAVGHLANGFTRYFNKANGYAGDNLLNSVTIGDPPNDVSYTYSYDANGNMIQENSDRFLEWNYADKLTFFKRQAGTGDPSVWVHYLYDNDGNRIKKIVNKTGGVQEVTVYIDGFYEYSYTKNSGSFDNNRRYNKLHIMDGTSKIATVRVGTDADADSAGIPTQLFYVEDHLGNSSVVVQTNGNRFNLEEYYPFGETSFGSYAKKRYRYNGKEKDEHTGLYEYGQRYYAPWLCRFVSVDPIAEKFPHLSSYNYASNRPVTDRDLEGLQAEGEKSQGGAQTDASGNLTGEYVVTEGQGPTQIAKDLMEVHGVEIDLTSVIDDPRNQKYFSHISKEKRYVKSNKEYENLNLNPDDIIYYNVGDNEFVGPPNKSESEIEQVPESNFLDKLTLDPKFTLKFDFGVGASAEGIFVGGGTAQYAGVNHVGWEDNDFYLAGYNKSKSSDTREVVEEYTGSFGGYGIGQKNTYDSKRKDGNVMKSETTFELFGIINITQIDDRVSNTTVQQLSLNQTISFGFILMPEMGIDLILYSDTISK